MKTNITYRERKKGNWQYIISYKENDFSKWNYGTSKQGFSKKSIAKEAAEEALKEFLKEYDKESKLDSEFKGITFKEFTEEYIMHMKKYRSWKTVESTKSAVGKFKDLNDIEMIKISTMDVQKAVDSMIDTIKTNTIKYYLKKLNIIFNSALNQYNVITKNPCKGVITNQADEIIKRALIDSEIATLLDKSKGTEFYLVYLIAINTGMRFGEILGLKWDDIDYNNSTIKVERQWKKLDDNTYGFGTLKTKNSKRTIPVKKTFLDELLTYKKIINIDQRVFDIYDKAYAIFRINRHIKTIIPDITAHELRHTYATKLVASGVLDFKTISSILGHTVAQTIKTYSHVNSDMLSKAQKVIEEIF
jgi:integrase